MLKNKKNFYLLAIISILIITTCTIPGGGSSGGSGGGTTVVNQTGCLLTININGSGTVNKTPNTQYYPTGTNVTLIALPNQGYAFDHWEGDLNATVNQATIFMNTNKTVKAVFVQSAATFTLTTAVTGSGTITKNPDLTNYLTGTSATLTATPITGYIFDHWEGDLTGSTNPATINMSVNNKTVTAVFVALYNLNVNVSPNNSGVITINPSQTNYKNGSSVIISVLPKPGYAFNNWSGDLTGNLNPATIIMNGNMNITANFITSSATFTLNTTSNGPGTISTNPNMINYLTGTSVVVTAIPNSGSIFDHWEGDLTGSVNPSTINMNINKNITAVFIGPRGTLTGTVVDSLGGTPVSNATISLTASNKTAVTDSNGYFNIVNVPVGNYDVNISANGRAGSKMQSINILDGQTTKVELVDTIYDFSSTQVTPPTISVAGLTSGSTYSGTVPITINVSAGSCSVIGTGNHASIYLKIGSNTGAIEDSKSTSNTLSYSWNASNYPSGNINIKITSYDINNNRSELNIPVIISSSSGSVPTTKPTSDYYDIQALTFGASLEIFKQQNKTLNLQLGNKSKTLSPNDNAIMSAPENSTIYVEIWLYYYYGSGMSVLRSNSQNGTYVEVGKTTYFDSSNDAYLLVDYSSDLTPGQTYWYKIAYFNNYGIGLYSDPISVLILPNFNLNLVSPANNSTITTNTPTLTWTSGTISGATRYDWIEITDILSNTIVYSTSSNYPLVNTSQITTPALTYNKQYQWDVVQSQYVYWNSAYVYSVALPSTGGSSSNGAFNFSVVNQ